VLSRWTVDVESDWGGRDNSIRGIEFGVPYILDLFEKYGIIGTFFLSTKKLEFYLPLAKEILYRGHTIGSHGHEHKNWGNESYHEWYRDYCTSAELLYKYLGVNVNFSLYRAPWFSRNNLQTFDRKRNHVSVLKDSWFGGRIPENPIFYIHPFDIYRSPDPAPNLFCKILYSRPEAVRETFHELVQKFS
jgi:peptidoglycan/xylan/chitin deacetylase (PgdA/CDA1 family)